MLLDLLDEAHRAPAECRIYVDGREIADLYAFLREVSVETSRTEAWAATLSFSTVRDELGRWTVQDEGILVRWAQIAIEIVFGDHSTSLFKGYIREVNTNMPEDAGNAEITVECQDQSLRLDRNHRRESWGAEDNPTSDRLIVEQLLADYGLRLVGDSENGEEGVVELAQDDSDIRFLKSRAEFNGYELIFYPDQVYFGPFRYQANPQAPIRVYAGQSTNCLTLTVNGDGHLPDAVAVEVPAEEGEESEQITVYSNLEPMGKERADSRDLPLEDYVETLSGESGASRERLEAKAQAKINDVDLHRLQAEGELDGTLYGHVLRPGLPVPVDGLGERLSGIYYVDSVSHQFNHQGYRQAFVLLRNAYGDNLEEHHLAPPRLAGVL